MCTKFTTTKDSADPNASPVITESCADRRCDDTLESSADTKCGDAVTSMTVVGRKQELRDRDPKRPPTWLKTWCPTGRCPSKWEGKVETCNTHVCPTTIRSKSGILLNAWRTTPWGLCDKSCGLGKQSRKVFCVNNKDVLQANDKCPADIKPSTGRDCNLGRCPPPQIAVKPTDTTTDAPEGSCSDHGGNKPECCEDPLCAWVTPRGKATLCAEKANLKEKHGLKPKDDECSLWAHTESGDEIAFCPAEDLSGLGKTGVEFLGEVRGEEKRREGKCMNPTVHSALLCVVM